MRRHGVKTLISTDFWVRNLRFEGKTVLQFACPNCGYFAIDYNLLGSEGKRVDYCIHCQTEFPLSGFDISKFIYFSSKCICGHEPRGSTHDRGHARCRLCDCEQFIPEWVEIGHMP
jgi:hypothetical protein